jgi:N-glycosylase/DNA lyase
MFGEIFIFVRDDMYVMRLDIDVSLDPTLGCGQAHRWVRKGDSWEGVLGNSIITLREDGGCIVCEGTADRGMVLDYLRHRDDLGEIYDSISGDPFVRELAAACPGMRILKQDPWECTATYLLATNANVKRIGSMVDSVCRTFGRDLGGRWSFPSAEEILDGAERIGSCRLGYRDTRLIGLAEKVADKIIVPGDIAKMDRRECLDTLMDISGIGNKVADCISLFSFGHLDAFPIDARIENILRERYGITGNYRKLSAFAEERFGEYAGYAQELLYHCGIILGSQAQVGGSQPI